MLTCFASAHGVGLNPPDVAVRDLVLRVDGHRQGLDGREVQSRSSGLDAALHPRPAPWTFGKLSTRKRAEPE